jgi:hypothetical protein
MNYHAYILAELRKERKEQQLPLDLPPTETELQLPAPRPQAPRDFEQR